MSYFPIASGTYTPVLTAVANVADSTSYQAQYLRVGKTVTVSGLMEIDPTLADTLTQIGVSLPIASNIGAIEDCCGVGSGGIQNLVGGFQGDSTNDRAQFNYTPTGAANQTISWTLTYQII